MSLQRLTVTSYMTYIYDVYIDFIIMMFQITSNNSFRS